MNKISVLCYPSHTTHVLQGLGVVVFAILKRYLSEEWDKWERETGEKISKTNFITIYGQAHNHALPPENITASFCKTGVWPFDPSVITKDMMATSKETFCWAHLPVPPVTPVHILADLFQKMSLDDGGSDSDSENKGEGNMNPSSITQRSMHEAEGETAVVVGQSEGGDGKEVVDAVKNLVKGDKLAFLAPSNPISGSFTLSTNTQRPIPEMKHNDALNIIPKTTHEHILLDALQDSELARAELARWVIELQTASALNEAYCSRLQGQLLHQEEKKKKDSGNGKLMEDGMPCLLSGDWFFKKVTDHLAAQKQKEHDKVLRAEDWEERSKAIVEWKKKQDERNALIAKRKAEWEEEKRQWEIEKEQAKEARPKKWFTKPKPLLGKLPPAIKRPPLLGKIVGEEAMGENTVESDSGDDNDNSSDGKEL